MPYARSRGRSRTVRGRTVTVPTSTTPPRVRTFRQRVARHNRPASGSSSSVSRSRTRTATIFKKPKSIIPGMSGAGTFSTFSIPRPMSNFDKKLTKDLAIQTYNTVKSTSMRFPQNTQGVTSNGTMNLFTQDDLDVLFAVNINPNPDTQRLLMGSANMCVNIANPSNAPVCFDIYDICYRHDMPKEKPIDNLSNSPNSLWFDGNADMGVGDIIVPGQSPFQCPKFVQNVKVLGCTKVQLPQGSLHEHRVHVDMNRMVDFTRLHSVGDFFYRNTTYCCMLVARGTPVDDGANVGLSHGGLNIVTTKKYEWWIPSQATSRSYQLNNLTDLDTEDIVNIGSGQVDSVTVA